MSAHPPTAAVAGRRGIRARADPAAPAAPAKPTDPSVDPAVGAKENGTRPSDFGFLLAARIEPGNLFMGLGIVP